MKPTAKALPIILCLLMPAMSRGQKLGQVACTKQDSFAYLYTSIETMEIRAKLKCGEQVQILDHSDNLIRVRTEEGEGFVAVNELVLLKTAPSAKPTAARSKQKGGPKSAKSDKTASASVAPAPAPPREIVVARQTPVHLKLAQTLSSATAHVGEEVTFEVTQDVVVGGITVIAKGATGIGAVTEAETKKRMGKAGKLEVDVSLVTLANNEKAAVRSFGAEPSEPQKTGRSLPLLKGKDVTLAKDTEITAYIYADLHLKAASFKAAAATSAQAGDPKP